MNRSKLTNFQTSWVVALLWKKNFKILFMVESTKETTKKKIKRSRSSIKLTIEFIMLTVINKKTFYKMTKIFQF